MVIVQTSNWISVQTRRPIHSWVIIVELIFPPLPVRVCVVPTVAGLIVPDNAHQETIPDWNDMQSLDTSLIESTGFEGNYFPVGDLSLEVGYEMLPDRDTLEGARCFFEGRGLLLGARMSF